MQVVQIVFGLLIIILTFLDFFHSTLSGNGFGLLSGRLNRSLNLMIIRYKNKWTMAYSGLAHLLLTTFVWLGLLFGGALTIFTASDQMVINGSTHLPASMTERFYFTAYLLSTLGIGDFIPGNDTSQILSGILSFSGFVLITTGMAYLLSVVQALLSKKQLSFYLSTMGKDVEEIYGYFKKDQDLGMLMSHGSGLKRQILSNASSYIAFPMVNYFLTEKRNSSLILQLAMLYEVLNVLKLEWEEESMQKAELDNLTQSIERYLLLGLEGPKEAEPNADHLRTLRSFWLKYGYHIQGNREVDQRFAASLKYACWSWESVYQLDRKQQP